MGKQTVTSCDVCNNDINHGDGWRASEKSQTLLRLPSVRRRIIHWILGGHRYHILDFFEGWRRAYVCRDCREEIRDRINDEEEE